MCLLYAGVIAHYGLGILSPGHGETSWARHRASVIAGIETFLKTTGIAEHRFGIEAVGDTKVLRRLRRGYGVSLSTIERIESYIEGHQISCT